MALSIRPIDPVNRPFFAGEISGIDLHRTMTQGQVGAIVEGMDKFAVLVFGDQKIDDAWQLAFSRNFGVLEIANSDVRRDEDRRLAPEVADVSNLGKGNAVMPREDRRRLFSLGNMLWHSDSSFKPTPAKNSLLHARILPKTGGNIRAACSASTSPMKSGSGTRRWRSGWCAAIRAAAGGRCSSRRMPARSAACRCPRRARFCAT